MLTDQWFVDTEGLAKDAIDAVERGHSKPQNSNPSSGPTDNLLPMGEGQESNPLSQGERVPAGGVRGSKPNGDKGGTRFIPENWKKTYDHWMENIQPWCISRQLWWGHQIPAWYGPKIVSEDKIFWGDKPSYQIFVANDETELESKVFEYYRPILDEWHHHWDIYDNEVEYNAVLGESLEQGTIPIIRDPDVLDTWFSSGLWPFSTLGWPENTEELERFYPTSVVVTAFDIIFFWVARMMMQGLHFMDEVPFKDVYIHALVLDEQGKKMSKSIGNTLDPLDLIDGVSIEDLVAKRTRGLKNPEKAPQIAKATKKQYPDGFEPYGADALRFTLASMAGQGRNIRLSVDRIAGYRNFGTKLWSAASFGQMNGCKPVVWDPAWAKLSMNKWIVSELSKRSPKSLAVLKAIVSMMRQMRPINSHGHILCVVFGNLQADIIWRRGCGER